MKSPRFFISAALAALAFAAGTAQFARADWNSGERVQLQKLSDHVSAYRNNALKAVQSGVKLNFFAPKPEKHFEIVPFSSADFTNPGAQPYFLSAKSKSEKPSDLVIVFPGVFGSAKDPGMMRAGIKINQEGNHVAILPNPWTKSYLKSWPKADPGQVSEESTVMLAMVHAAIEKIGTGNIRSLRFFGESYGAYLAMSTAALYAEQTDPHGSLPVVSVTSVSLPLDITFAMTKLDALLDQEEGNYYDRGCAKKLKEFFPVVGLAYTLIVRANADEVYYRGQKCAEAFFAYSGFHDDVVSTIAILNQENAAKKRTEISSDGARSLRFKTLVEWEAATDHSVEILNSSVQALHVHGVSLQVVLAKDDPITDGIQEQAPFTQAEFFVLPKGGHLGFRADSAYRQLIEMLFKN